jgi:UDP-N-acetylmuramyl pentapeptide synthase
LKPELDAGVTVLVKGSRSSRMERVVTALTEGQK